MHCLQGAGSMDPMGPILVCVLTFFLFLYVRLLVCVVFLLIDCGIVLDSVCLRVCVICCFVRNK